MNIIPLFISLLLGGLSLYIFYLIIKAAVRNGIKEAATYLDPGASYWKSIVKKAVAEAIKESVEQAAQNEQNKAAANPDGSIDLKV